MIAKRFKIVLAEEPNLQEAAERKQPAKRAETKRIKAEQEAKEKLDRSASKLDHPTPEMPGMHQPSAYSKNI